MSEIHEIKEYIEPSVQSNNALIKNESKPVITHIESKVHEYAPKYFYLSDLHLDTKIEADLGTVYTTDALVDFLKTIVDRIFVATFGDKTWSPKYFILLGGDVSHNPTIVKTFLGLFKARFYRCSIVYILGNHEYWNWTQNGMNVEGYSADGITEMYRTYCRENDIIFLQNDILLINPFQAYLLDEQSIMKMSEQELQDIFCESDQIILGGTGFASKNSKFNASQGIYRNTICSVEEEKKLTERFELIHSKLNKAIGFEKRVIIFTHMPYWDWAEGAPNPNWTYVSGHTHKNTFSYDDNLKMISDNQWGYENCHYAMKCFYNEDRFDIFATKSDGIYRITSTEYTEYYAHLRINIQCSLNVGQILLLKNEGFYFFMCINSENKLYWLNGGRRRKCDTQNVQYYYENMPYVGSRIIAGSEGYMNLLRNVSRFIRNIGGVGSIHGCIVDIDFLNHIYVNPRDLTITPYFANDMVDKYVYRNVPSLLKAKCPNIYDNYAALLEGGKRESLMAINSSDQIVTEGVPYRSTDIYSDSRKVKALQYTVDQCVIRAWADPTTEKTCSALEDISKYPILTVPKFKQDLVSLTNVYNPKSEFSKKALYEFVKSRYSLPDGERPDAEEIIAKFKDELYRNYSYDLSDYQSSHEYLLSGVNEAFDNVELEYKNSMDLLLQVIRNDYCLAKIENILKIIRPGSLFKNKGQSKSRANVVPCHIDVECNCDEAGITEKILVDTGLFFKPRWLIGQLISDICESLISVGETNRLRSHLSLDEDCIIDENKLLKKVFDKTTW